MDRPKKRTTSWGEELVWSETEEYAAKVCHIGAGQCLPLQLHEERDKTLFVRRGQGTLELGAGIHSLKPVPIAEGDSVRVRPGVVHRVIAATDVELLEVGTHDMDDVILFEDPADNQRQDAG